MLQALQKAGDPDRVGRKSRMIPKNLMKLEGKNAQGMLRLSEALEEHDDVQNVYSNFDVDEKEVEMRLALGLDDARPGHRLRHRAHRLRRDRERRPRAPHDRRGRDSHQPAGAARDAAAGDRGGIARSDSAAAPEAAAVEEVFYAQNVKTALKLSHARGVALLAIAEAGMSLGEYSPLEIKTSVVGYGRAEKQQVRMMVHSLLAITDGDRIGRRLRRHRGGDLPCHAPASEQRDEGGAMRLLRGCCACAAAASRAGGSRGIVYSKYFKGSVPEYVAITVEQSGAARCTRKPRTTTSRCSFS